MFISEMKHFLAGLLVFASGCSHLVYHPSDLMYVQHPELLNGLREEISFPSTDGTKLAGWYFKAKKKGHKGTVIQFHGNAENMTSHFASLVWLTEEGYDFFTFDYRGYGISEGKPDQEGINRDAIAAIHYVMNRSARGAEADLVLYGQSLGGAVLLRAYDDIPASERRRIKALVVEGAFSNYHEIAADILSRSWLTYVFQPLAYVLVSNAYGPGDAIPRISPTPLLVIHGAQDPVIPYKFGEEVFALAQQPKQFLRIPGGKHINAMAINHGEYRGKLLEFLLK
jgi:fermentation-respiration switch protein FrsA (DUF1100 family)